MKGLVRVSRADLLSAIIGYELRLDSGKDLLDDAINRFYESKYLNGSWLTKLIHRKKTKREFVKSQMNMFGNWVDILYIVLDKDERNELDWWCWNSISRIEPIRSLYKASKVGGYILIDHDMADIVVYYKDYLEKIN